MKSEKSLSQYSRPLIASLLISGGLLQLAAPVLAEGTPAGTTISNTATASYEDPSDPNKPLNAVSNTVEVKVAEVAGITVVADTFTLVKGAGNSGTAAEANDTVNFDFTVTNVGNDPSKLRIPGTAASTGASTVSQVQYFDTLNNAWVDIANGGEYITPTSVAPGGSVKVRVIANILPTATASSPVTVTLGNTVTPGLQNVTRDATTGDVYTVDGTDPSVEVAGGEIIGAPSNGVREAAASQTIIIGATPQAFAAVTKVRTANDATSLTYNLGLSVANQAPAGINKLAADLQATPITLNGVSANKVLVSDAVPLGTTASTLTVPAGWQAVYTTDGTATLANVANWLPITGTGTVNVPAGATRVGFIADGPVTKGSTVSGFGVKVAYDANTIANGATIANIAQVFGGTKADGTGADVYDESGDSKPNNINDNGSEPATNTVTDGVGNSADPDGNNNNTGTGPAGESNVFTVVPPGQVGLLNGTSNTPGAVGPSGNNDDFTNLTTPIPAGTGRTAQVNPAPLGFANTFELAGTNTENVSLIPTKPAAGTQDLPNGTLVTISYGSTSKTFEYQNGAFVVPGTTTPATALVIAAVVPGTKVNYEVTVDLPNIDQRVGYGIPITAFVDTDNSGTPGATEKQNITIDRVYAGYLNLDKKAQILDKDGVTVIEDFTDTPTKKAAPGQMIRYQITYSNVSDIAPAGSGSVALSAKNVAITEDGAANGNNWAANTDHKSGSAADSTTGIVLFNNGAKTNADPTVTVYKDTVDNVAPQGSGTFSFTRVVR